MKCRLPAICVLVVLLAAPAAASAAFGDRPLKRGATGEDVETLQALLTEAGHRTAVDGVYGRATVRSVKAWETKVERRVNGRVNRREARMLAAQVQQAPAEALRGKEAERAANPKMTGGASYVEVKKARITADGKAIAPSNAPRAVKRIIAAGNRISHKPYRYGGGHGRWNDTGYDCSGSVSYALHGAGLLDASMPSGGFTKWGAAGPGNWVTIYAHGGHMYMVVAGLRFDTSGASERGGSRWTDEMRSPAGFAVRHPRGL